MKTLMKKIILLILLSHSAMLFAKDDAIIRDGINTWSVIVDKNEGVDVLKIKEQRGHEISYETDSIAHNFVSVTPLTFTKNGKLYLVTLWNKGAHGETIRVMNPEAKTQKDLVVFEYNSAWPLKYELKEGKLVVTGKGDLGPDGITPLDEIRTFSP